MGLLLRRYRLLRSGEGNEGPLPRRFTALLQKHLLEGNHMPPADIQQAKKKQSCSAFFFATKEGVDESGTGFKRSQMVLKGGETHQ